MFIIEFNEGRETLKDIERICRHLVEHKKLVSLMTEPEIKELSYILQPTFAADHNEAEKRKHWEKVVKEFVIYDKHGNAFKFYRDEVHQRLYFGDQEGFETIENFVEHENGSKFIAHH